MPDRRRSVAAVAMIGEDFVNGADRHFGGAGAGSGEPVAGLADDVAAAILGQGERQVEDEAAFGVLASGMSPGRR